MENFLPILAAVGLNVLAAGFLTIAWLFYQQVRGDERYRLVTALVEAAEQIFQAPDEGAARKQWVLEQLERRFPQLDVDLVQALVEAAVYRLHAAQVESRPRIWIEVASQAASDTDRETSIPASAACDDLRVP